MKNGSVLVASLTLCSSLALADNVVTYVQDSPKNGPIKSYLQNSPSDNAYIYITAKFSNPADTQCVSPINSDSPIGLFIRSNVDLGIGVQPLGFFGIDPKVEIPLATYTYSSDKQYCKSSWRQPIVVVPPTPFAIGKSGLDLTDNPSLIVQFRSSAQPKISIVEPMQALIGVAGAMTTGGAANTVVGISKVATGPAVEFLNKEFENRRKTAADGTLELNFTWNEIIGGLKGKSFNLINGERGWRESADDAIARIRLKPNDPTNKVILTINFNIETRRSVFAKDSELINNLPQPSLTSSPYAILNFPGISGVPTIYQKINSEAPSILQGLKSKEVNACDKFLVTIKDLGFNRLDRAMIAGAVLDDATPGWRSDTNFYTACFRSEPTIPASLLAINSIYFPAPPPPPPVFSELELFTNPPADWPLNLTNYLTKARLSFYSKGDSRVNGIAMSDATKAILITNLPGLENILTKEQENNAGLRLDDLIKSLQINQVGCFFGFSSAADNTWRAAMIISIKEKEGNIEPYIFQATFPAASVAPGAVADKIIPTYIDILPILSPIATNFSAWFNTVNFDKRSLCSRKDGQDGYALLNSLKNTGVKQ